MKRLLTIILTLTIFINVHSQAIVANDSAETGPSASQMTFYSLRTGTKTVVQNDDWDLAVSIKPSLFPTSPLGGTTIRMNEANGVKVYYVPNASATSFFSTLDTTGYRYWTKLHDSDTSINEGALNSNRDRSYIYDFGWGVYTGASSNHNVVGDSLYLIQLPNGKLKKLWVVALVRDTAFDIRYSNIDNSDMDTFYIRKKAYLGKEFVYLNLATNVVMDKEPLAADWDMQFLKYAATDILANKNLPTVGVWLNHGAKAAKRDGHDIGSNDYSNLTFSDQLNAIGWNWKYPGNFMSLLSGKNILESMEFYLTRDSLAYFVQTNAGEFYKVAFTRYNVYNGRIYFYKELLGGINGIGEPETENNKVGIYPNPANTVLNVVTCTPSSTLRIVDITGRIVFENNTTQNSTQVNTSEFTNGVYLLMVTSNGKTSAQKFIVSR